MRQNIFLSIIILVCISWQCSKDEQQLSLKEAIDANTGKINAAFETIAVSEGYKIISVTEDGVKSDYFDGFRDSIDLDLISGIYDFHPGTGQLRNYCFPFRLFLKTGTSDKLIINLPEKLVFQPRYLHFCDRADSVLKNNFTITSTDYHFYYNRWNNHDYKLATDFTRDSETIGNLRMFSSWNSESARSLSGKFTFPEGYSVSRSAETGDTNKIMFSLSHDEEILLQESIMFLGDGFKRKEKLYKLSLGNVDIVRGTEIDSIEVYLDGVLQKTAGARILDDQDYNASICHKRDILLTFDDGTSQKLSEMIAPARETLRYLSRSMGEMYLSKNIIDYIAFSIYFCNQ
jgi:hypothetical protein